MPAINKILSNFNSNQFYKLKNSDLDPKTIDKAINKDVSLTNDVNNVLKYNPVFLTKYIKKFGNTRFINELELIDFTKFNNDDIKTILTSMYLDSKISFIKTLNNYPQFIKLIDFKYFILSEDEVNELNDSIFHHYKFNEIPKELLKDNKELIRKYLNTDYLFDIYKDLINSSNELKNDILNKVIENIRNDKTLLNRLSKDDIKLMLTYDISFGKELLDYFYENNKDVTILKDYFVDNADYDYYYLMQNFEKISESSDVFTYFRYNHFNTEQKINITKKYLNRDRLDENELLYLKHIIASNDELCNLLFNAYENKKIKVHKKGLLILLCKKFPKEMIELDKNNLYEYLRLGNLDLKEFNYIFNEYISKLTREELINHKDIFNTFIRNIIIKCSYSDSDYGKFMDKLFELDILDLLDYDVLDEIRNFVKFHEKSFIMKLLKLPSFENCRIKEKILNELRKNNFDIDTILPNYEYSYNLNGFIKEKVIDILNKIKERNIDCKIKLIMYRLDKDFINEANNILPGKIKVAPIEHQENDDIPLSYEVKEILEKDRTLDVWAKSITATKEDANGNLRGLSPFEIVVACYKVSTHFKKYTLTDKSEYSYSRSIYEFINNPDPEICCVGYSNLFMELLTRCGIDTCYEWSVKCEREEKESNWDNHSRVMIYLDDPKYEINGIYMCDPTWDSIESDNTSDYKYNYSSFKHFLMDRQEAESETDEFPKKEYLHFDDDIRYERLNVSTIKSDDIPSLTRKPIDQNKLLLALSTIDMFITKGIKMPVTLEVGKENGIPQTIYDEICAENCSKLRIAESKVKDLVSKSSIKELLEKEQLGYYEPIEYIEDSIRNKLSEFPKKRMVKLYQNGIAFVLPGDYSDTQFDTLVSIYGKKRVYHNSACLYIILDVNGLDFNKKYSELEQDILECINNFEKEFKQLLLSINNLQEINLEKENIAKK